jgi:hypothetical protein
MVADILEVGQKKLYRRNIPDIHNFRLQTERSEKYRSPLMGLQIRLNNVVTSDFYAVQIDGVGTKVGLISPLYGADKGSHSIEYGRVFQSPENAFIEVGFHVQNSLLAIFKP